MSVSHLLRIFPILLISSYLPFLFLILPILSSLSSYLLSYPPHPLSASSSSKFLTYPPHPFRLSLFLIHPILSTCLLFYTFLIFLFFLSSPCSLPHSSNPLPYPHLFSYFLILHFPYFHHHSHPPLFFILPSSSCHPPPSPLSISSSHSHSHLLFLFLLHPFILPVLSTYFPPSSWICLRILILRIPTDFLYYT
jgi:hypothetical protein